MLLVGDPSGDQHAARVVQRLMESGCSCYGIGGPAMKAAGFVSLLPFEPFNCMGFFEVVARLPFLLKAKAKLVRCMRASPPDVVVCVDYSGFNMPMMKAAHGMGIPVVWYVAPMVWAWKKDRYTESLHRYAEHLAVVLPFEKEVFGPKVKAVSYVGHPLVEALEGRGFDLEAKRESLARGCSSLAIVPGSREQEIRCTLPIMVETFAVLEREHPGIKATVSKCAHIPERMYACAIGRPGLAVHEGPLEELLYRSDMALVTSGTATLQAALLGVPMVILYRTSPLTYYISRKLLKTRWIGLPNIIADENIVPECVQADASPGVLARQMERYIQSEEHRLGVFDKLVALGRTLGSRCASEEVAGIVLRTATVS